LGQREIDLPPRAQSSAGANSRRHHEAVEKTLSTHRPPGTQHGPWGGTLSGFAGKSVVPGRLAHVKSRVRPRTNPDARRRLDSHCESFQKSSARRFPAPWSRPARRQRAFTQRKIQPRLPRKRNAHGRVALDGIGESHNAMSTLQIVGKEYYLKH